MEDGGQNICRVAVLELTFQERLLMKRRADGLQVDIKHLAPSTKFILAAGNLILGRHPIVSHRCPVDAILGDCVCHDSYWAPKLLLVILFLSCSL